MPVNDLIILRKGTDAVWSGINPVLSSGEPGYDSTYNLLKVGNGTSSWLDLNPVNLSGTYFNSAVSGLLPVKNIVAGSDISVSSTSGIYTINNTMTSVETSASVVTTVFNKTGASIPKMTAVYINGGQGDLPTIQKALATADISSAGTYGITYEAIDNMSSGRVIVLGALTGLNTDQFNPTAPQGDVNGTVVYLSPTVSGALTTTKPYAPYHIVAMGTIVRTHQNVGVIEVRVQNGYELDELHNVAITGATNGQFLQYNSVSGLWVPSSSGNFTTLQVNGTAVPTGTGSANYVTKWTGTNSLNNSIIYDNGTNIGIGTSSPSYKLDVVGTGNFSQNLLVNGTRVSLSGHTHSSSDITNFNSSVSGLLPTIANSGDNRVLTSTGSAVGINAESNLTFDGSLLSVTGSGSFSSNLSLSNQTASTIAGFDSSKNIVSLNTTTYPSLTELSYVKGVTSSIQTQLDNKAASSHNHTSSNITDWNEAVDDRVSNLLVGISGINISYNDAGNILNIAYTGAGGGGGVTINNYSNNRVLTSDGTSTGIDAENNLVFIPSSSGNKLGIGTINPNGNLSLSNGNFAIDGDSQKSFLTVRNSTTNNTSTTLYLDGSSTKIVLPPKSVWNFHINLSCYSDTNEGAASWNFKGCIKRTSSTTALVASIIEENFIDSSLNGVSATVVANTGTSSLDINVSGLNSNNIRWTAGVDFVQTRYDSTNYFLPMKFDMVP